MTEKLTIPYDPVVLDGLDPCANLDFSSYPWMGFVTSPYRQITIRFDPAREMYFFCYEGRRVSFKDFMEAHALATRLVEVKPNDWLDPREITEAA